MNPLLRLMVWCFYHRPIQDITNCMAGAWHGDARQDHPGRAEALKFLEQWGKR